MTPTHRRRGGIDTTTIEPAGTLTLAEYHRLRNAEQAEAGERQTGRTGGPGRGKARSDGPSFPPTLAEQGITPDAAKAARQMAAGTDDDHQAELDDGRHPQDQPPPLPQSPASPRGAPGTPGPARQPERDTPRAQETSP